MRARFEMPHPAIVTSGPQLASVIEGLEAGTYPQPDDAIWRGDLPRDVAVRLARATGATDEQVSELLDAGESDGCSCCQARSLAGMPDDECARCGHLGKRHVTCNLGFVWPGRFTG